MESQTKTPVPVFATEAEEAKWWFKNRNLLVEAVKTGQAQVLTKAKLQERIAASKKTASPVVSLRIPAHDLQLARKQAERKGLPYQTYIKQVLYKQALADLQAIETSLKPVGFQTRVNEPRAVTKGNSAKNNLKPRQQKKHK